MPVVKLTDASAKAAGEKLIAQKPAELSRAPPKWSVSYGPADQGWDEAQQLDDVAQEELEELIPDQFKLMAAGGWKHFKVWASTKAGPNAAKNAGPAPKGEAVLEAYYSKTSMIVMGTFRVFDTTPKSKALQASELMVQGAKETKSVPTSIIHYSIKNDETLKFMQEAAAATEKKFFTIKGTGAELDWFKILLGSDNGRTAQQMFTFHPSYLGQKSIVQINILSKNILEFIAAAKK